MFSKSVFCLLLFCATLWKIESAKILGIFNYPSKSHHILGNALLVALARRGHQVTMISPYSSNPSLKNYEDVVLTGIADYKNHNTSQGITEMQELTFFQRISRMRYNIHKIDKMFLDHPSLQELLASNRTYDLVILNWLFNSASLGIAHHYNASVIAFSTFGSSILINQITGNSGPYAYVPNLFLSFPSEMTFLQRVGNTIGTLGFEFLEYHDAEMHERHLQEYFPKAPPLQELLQNVSLVLINSHFSIESPRPYIPSMIPIGGFHIDEPKELVGDLKEFMDNSVEGVLYFSFGSNVKSAGLPKNKLQAIIESFRKLPVKILWKFENDHIANLPPNVKISKWFPQTDILAHPNTRVFVTHGGLLSTIEAIYHAVPVVGIPFFADQEYNIADSVSKGYAVKVAYQELSQETLTAAINEVLNNIRYRENIKMRSAALKDQPLKPMDSAIFWVEYVLRHRGAPILQTSSLKLYWYQYFLVDVFAFLAVIMLVTIGGLYVILNKLLEIAKELNLKKPRKLSVNCSKKSR